MGFLLSNVLRLEKDAHFFFIFIEYPNIPHANFNSNPVNNSPTYTTDAPALALASHS